MGKSLARIRAARTFRTSVGPQPVLVLVARSASRVPGLRFWQICGRGLSEWCTGVAFLENSLELLCKTLIARVSACAVTVRPGNSRGLAFWRVDHVEQVPNSSALDVLISSTLINNTVISNTLISIN